MNLRQVGRCVEVGVPMLILFISFSQVLLLTLYIIEKNIYFAKLSKGFFFLLIQLKHEMHNFLKQEKRKKVLILFQGVFDYPNSGSYFHQSTTKVYIELCFSNLSEFCCVVNST